MQRSLLLPLLLGSLCASAVTLAGTMIFFPPASRAAPEPQATVPLVRAERIELVDRQGTVRGLLAVGGDGPDSATAFTLSDYAGTRRVTISVLNNGGQVTITPGSAPDTAEVRRMLGRPETLPG